MPFQHTDLYPYWTCSCRHPNQKVFYADALQLQLNYGLLAKLSALGVRRVDLTPEATVVLANSMRALFNPNVIAPDPPVLAGISIHEVQP